MLSQDGAMVSGRFCSWPEVCHPPFPEAVPAHSNDVDQSIRFDADQIGAKRRKALSV
jgi:hypothetical protein